MQDDDYRAWQSTSRARFIIASLVVLGLIIAGSLLAVNAMGVSESPAEVGAKLADPASDTPNPLFEKSLATSIDELNGVVAAPVPPPPDDKGTRQTSEYTAYWTCIVSCSVTCATDTCSGPACDQTMDTTCGGTTCSTTCGTTCSGATCETTCSSDCPPPGPKPTSRTWGHDSVGSAWIDQDWYMAEGCTAGGFETWVLVQNPNAESATVQVTYMTSKGSVKGPSATLPAYSRTSFNVAATVPDNADVSTYVHSDKWVLAERAMYGPGRAWGHNSIGSHQPSIDWYLAEGCTAGGFETWVLVQNPNSTPTDVWLTYMTPQGPKDGPQVTLPARSRKSFNVADVVPNAWEVSTLVSGDDDIVAERSCYWNNRKGGHESVGVSEPATNWYLAEGSTAAGFETFVLVQNPTDVSASVSIDYMTESGKKTGPRLSLPAQSRKTVNVGDIVPNTWSVSTRVTSNQAVIAERAVYWNGRIEGHDSIGVSEAAEDWALAEGSTGSGFETWILVQNPNSQDAEINITFMTPDGQVQGPSDTIPANSRKSYNVAETLDREAEISTLVSSDIPVIAERAMYGDPR